MANDILKNTRECKYKGVPFLCERIVGTEGRATVNYLYMNSGRRVSKDLGEFPAQFQVDGLINSNTMQWQEFIDGVNALRSVLNSGTPGKFSHPFLGDFFCSNGKYTYNLDFKEVGVCRFSILFSKTDSKANPLTPTGMLFSKPSVNNLARAANSSLQFDTANAMSHNNPLNKKNTAGFLSKIGDKMKGKFSSLASGLQAAASFTGKALDMKEKAEFYADNPFVAFAAVSDMLLGVDGLTTDVFIKMKRIQDLFEYGSENDTESDVYAFADTRINRTPITSDEAERKNNADVTKNFMQAGSMIEYMRYTADMKPKTTDDIDDTIEIIKEQYQRIRGVLISDSSNEENIYLSKPDYSDTINAIEQLNIAVDGLMRDKRQNAPKIITVTVPYLPVDVISYLLYEDSSRGAEIMSLNKLYDNMSVGGDIKVLSQ